MHIVSYNKTPPSNTPNKNNAQQEKVLMPFENKGSLQKWHMANTPPKTDKYNTHKIWCLTKIAHLHKYFQSSHDFLKGIIKFVVWFRLMFMGF